MDIKVTVAVPGFESERLYVSDVSTYKEYEGFIEFYKDNRLKPSCVIRKDTIVYWVEVNKT